MANNTTPTQTPQAVDPISAFRETYGNSGDYSDAQIYKHLSDPTKFRSTLSAHPQYGEQFGQMSDSDVQAWSQRKGLTRPDLSPPPSIQQPRPQALKPTTTDKLPPYDWTKAAVGGLTDILAPGTITPGKVEPSPGETMGAGTRNLLTPGKRGTGALQTTLGALDAAGPAAGPMMFENPVAFARAGVEGAAAGQAAKYGSKALGANPEQQGYAEQIGQAAPLLIRAALGSKNPTAPTRFDAKSGAAELHEAVNPAPQYKSTGPNEPIESFTDPKYKGQMEHQLPRIKQFADDQNHQINSQETLAQAAHGAANAQNAHFQQNVLGPNRNVAVPQPDWYQGKTENYGRVTLGEMYKRLADLNAELDPRYTKGGGGTQASQSAVRSTGEVQQEAAQIRQLLYGELAKATGQTPEQVAESNHAIGELRDIAEKTRGVAGKEDYAANKEGKKGMEVPTSKSGLVASVINKAVKSGRSALGIANPADRRIANVFNNLDIPSYSHAPVNPPTLGRVQNELNMTRASALGQLPTPANNPAAALGEIPSQGASGRELANPAQSSPVPAPIAAALGQGRPTQPTGEPLTTPPFAQPYQRGEELGELARQNNAGEVQALNRFVKGNPDPLSRIPVKIQRAVQPPPPPAPVDPRVEANTARWLEEYQRNKAAAQNAPPPPPSGLGPAAIERWQESIFNKKPAPDVGDKVRNEPGGGEPPRETKQAEAERLRARLKQLEDEGAKTIPQPERDTATFQSIQKEHPDWSLSQVAKEAAKRVKGNK